MWKIIKIGLGTIFFILIMADVVLFFAGYPLPKWVDPLFLSLMMTSLGIILWINYTKKKESTRLTTIIAIAIASGLSFTDFLLQLFYPR